MNIYAFIPLIATIAYIPLLVTAGSTRPLRKQHRLFLLLLIAAIAWSLTDFIFRSNYFPQYSEILIRVIICAFSWMAVQFHCFSSSFFPQDKGRWLPLAYGSLALNITLAVLGYMPERLTHIGAMLLPEYGYAAIIIAIPLLILLARNIYIFLPRLKAQDSPVKYNQSLSILLCLAVMTVFILFSIVPFGREFPIGHVGNIIIALILSYAVVGHQLVDIRFVLRRGFIWIITGIMGIASFWSLLLIFHFVFDIEVTMKLLLAATMSGIFSVIIIYKLKDWITILMGKAFQGESYNYREKLVDFANKIHNVFSLTEQGRELLMLITQALGCQKAALLFIDPNGDFEVQLMESAIKNDYLLNYKLRSDNPIIAYLKREKKPLIKENLAILPEFLGLWPQEKESIESNGIELFMPLISREKLIGVLALDNKKNGRYNLEDFSLLEDVTKRVAVSMEKEYLREQLKDREEELSVINRSNAIITSSLDIQRIYDNFIKELKRVVNVDWAAIAVIEDSEIYFMAVFTEIGSPWKVGELIPLKGTATEWVANHSMPLIDRDLTQENRFYTGKYHLQQSIRSIAFLPLIISNHVIGTLSVASREPDAYSSRNIKLLEQLAAQVAMPIENARLYAKTERMARVDSLTGLLNRRSLDEILPSEIGRHTRYGGIFSLIILDLDSFKSLNDNYGHLAGDELMRQIGLIMRNAIRESDRAFRYGGDEFAILLPQTNMEAALKVAERIRQQTYAKIEIGSKPISISLGIATWPVDGVVVNDLLAAADAALYQAKRNGGNRTQCSALKLSSEANEKRGVHSSESQDSSAISAIYALAANVDARDQYCHDHSKQVHQYAVAIGEELGMNSLEINHLGTCALLHDIGKIGISDEILNKQEILTDKEWEIIKTHPVLGAAIISHSKQLEPCVAGILHHHEKYHGEGYPDGLKGEEIPLESRILAIADAFSAMTSSRVYSKSITFEEAIKEIQKGAGTQFDPNLVQVFLKVMNKIVTSPEQAKVGNESI